jgi:hypothetical protein
MRGSLVPPTSVTAFSPLVAPALFPFLWIVLLAAGIAAMGAFFVYDHLVIPYLTTVRHQLSYTTHML